MKILPSIFQQDLQFAGIGQQWQGWKECTFDNLVKIQDVVLVTIYTAKAPYLTVKLLFSQQFCLCCVQWTNNSTCSLEIRLMSSQKMQLQGKSYWDWVALLQATEYCAGEVNEVPISDTVPVGYGTFIQSSNV